METICHSPFSLYKEVSRIGVFFVVAEFWELQEVINDKDVTPKEHANKIFFIVYVSFNSVKFINVKIMPKSYFMDFFFQFLLMIDDKIILISYNDNSGIAAINILITSAGVMIAAMIRIQIMACLLYVFMEFGVRILSILKI